MISLSDYTAHDGLGLAELVARKQVKPEELTATAFGSDRKGQPEGERGAPRRCPLKPRRKSGAACRKVHSLEYRFLIKELVLHAKGDPLRHGLKVRARVHAIGRYGN